jgi:hypothetical protein
VAAGEKERRNKRSLVDRSAAPIQKESRIAERLYRFGSVKRIASWCGERAFRTRIPQLKIQ